jgi:hypothetical protein
MERDHHKSQHKRETVCPVDSGCNSWKCFIKIKTARPSARTLYSDEDPNLDHQTLFTSINLVSTLMCAEEDKYVWCSSHDPNALELELTAEIDIEAMMDRGRTSGRCNE